jgi:hypothetical protein
MVQCGEPAPLPAVGKEIGASVRQAIPAPEAHHDYPRNHVRSDGGKGPLTENEGATSPENAATTYAMKESPQFPRCLTCKWWQLDEDSRYSRVIFPPDPATYEQEEDEEKNATKWGHRVRQCKHPKVLFYQRPERDGAAVCDGSEYRAELLTAENFGCVLHEAKNQT